MFSSFFCLYSGRRSHLTLSESLVRACLQGFTVSMVLFVFRVSKPPQTLEELGESLSLWEQLHNDQPKIEAKFQPLYDQFSIMEKYEVAIPDDVKEMLNNLSNDWVTFQQTLIEADAMLRKNKVSPMTSG